MTSTTLPHSPTSIIIHWRTSPMCRRDARNAFTRLPKGLLIHRPSTNLYSRYRKLPIKSLQFDGYAKHSNFLHGVYGSLVQPNAIRIRLVSPLPWLQPHCPARKFGWKVVSSEKVPGLITYLHMGSGKSLEFFFISLSFVYAVLERLYTRLMVVLTLQLP